VTVAPRADRSWQLFEHGLLVFEDAGSPSGPSRILVSRLELCTAPGCSCRDVGLRAISFEVENRDLARAGLTNEGLHSKFASDEAMNAQVDIDLGLVEPDGHEGRVPLSEEWTRRLQSQIDGELLELLHQRWLRAKGVTSSPHTDWVPRGTGELVGWDEAHPDDRQDLYLDGDVVVSADDLYCVKPACTCNEVRVHFVPTTRGAPPVGSVRVRLPSGAVIATESKPAKAAALDRLWMAFRARHRVAELLARRQQKMIELARLRAEEQPPTQPATSSRVGRNEPCPCGSGKKYKRCCAT
jgi:hypothetical protein